MKMNECPASLPRRRRVAGVLKRESVALPVNVSVCCPSFCASSILQGFDVLRRKRRQMLLVSEIFFLPSFTSERLTAALMKCQQGPQECSILVCHTYSLARGSWWASFSWWTRRSLKIGKKTTKTLLYLWFILFQQCKHFPSTHLRRLQSDRGKWLGMSSLPFFFPFLINWYQI